MHLANYPGYPHRAELDLVDGFRKVGEAHAQEADVYHLSHTLVKQCETHAEKLKPFVDRCGEEAPEEPEQLYHDLMASACDIAWTMIGQGAGDRELLEVVSSCEGETATQIKRIQTRMKQAAPQVLLVAS